MSKQVRVDAPVLRGVMIQPAKSPWTRWIRKLRRRAARRRYHAAIRDGRPVQR